MHPFLESAVRASGALAIDPVPGRQRHNKAVKEALTETLMLQAEHDRLEAEHARLQTASTEVSEEESKNKEINLTEEHLGTEALEESELLLQLIDA